MTIDELETPALLIDLDAMEQNIKVMADYMKSKRAVLRPHFKTHKCPAISHKQLDAGATGITCAKLGEAEVLAAAGVKDILIANQIVDPMKIYRLAGLARNGARITVLADSPENIAALSNAAAEFQTAVHVLVELDVGMKRCGVETKEAAYELACKVNAAEGLVFEGLQAYEGHLSHVADRAVRRDGVKKMEDMVSQVKSYMENRGIKVRQVSGGSTGTYDMTGDNTLWTEIQAGSYVFMDRTYRELGLEFQTALTLLTTVIHKGHGIAVTDAGLKVCPTDQGPPHMMGKAGLKVSLHEEHGIISDGNDELTYLEKVRYIPGHCCTMVNVHDRYYGIRGGRVETVWPILGRGGW